MFSNRPEGSPIKTKEGEYVGSGDEESSNTFEGIEYAAPTVAEEYDFNQYGRMGQFAGTALSALTGMPGMGFVGGEIGTAYGFDQAQDLAKGIMPDTPEYNALLEQLTYQGPSIGRALGTLAGTFGAPAAKVIGKGINKVLGETDLSPADAYQSVMDQFERSVFDQGIMGAMLEEGDRADTEEINPKTGEPYPDYRTMDEAGLLSDRSYGDLNVLGGMSNYGQTFDQLADPGYRGRYNFNYRDVNTGDPELTYDSLADWVSAMSQELFGPGKAERTADIAAVDAAQGQAEAASGLDPASYFNEMDTNFGFAQAEDEAFSGYFSQAQAEAEAEAEAEATADAVAEAEGVAGVDSTSDEISMDDDDDGGGGGGGGGAGADDDEDDYDDYDDDYNKGGFLKAGFAAGGIMPVAHNIARMKRGRYLGGATDGMADKIPATIDGKQKAALSDGEFVIPADVVSHLGNGNSDAGAKTLYAMMDRIRKVRTGSKKQGKEIRPKKFLPA